MCIVLARLLLFQVTEEKMFGHRWYNGWHLLVTVNEWRIYHFVVIPNIMSICLDLCMENRLTCEVRRWAFYLPVSEYLQSIVYRLVCSKCHKVFEWKLSLWLDHDTKRILLRARKRFFQNLLVLKTSHGSAYTYLRMYCNTLIAPTCTVFSLHRRTEHCPFRRYSLRDGHFAGHLCMRQWWKFLVYHSTSDFVQLDWWNCDWCWTVYRTRK